MIPLSPNSGLIGWVPNCDTLHALIREYRCGRERVARGDFIVIASDAVPIANEKRTLLRDVPLNHECDDMPFESSLSLMLLSLASETLGRSL